MPFSPAFGIAAVAIRRMPTSTAADMQAFLDGPFADLFEDPAWSSELVGGLRSEHKSRISTTELIETSANANDVGSASSPAPTR